MGLSTHVEISDHGSRRMINDAGVMPINEEDDDESGRSGGPAGTIGGDAVQDCVSENIESNTRRL